MQDKRIVALMHGRDKAGLVARVSNWIYDRGGSIEHADQHKDRQDEIFFQRVQWIPEGDAQEEMRLFTHFAQTQLEMETEICLFAQKQKIALFTSQFTHCFCDIVTRQQQSELNCEIPLVVSNHETLKEYSQKFDLDYHYMPISKETKAEVEAEQIRLIKESGATLVVMARYMQILSDDFLKNVGVPVINIHHSFLPAFIGARPYHQAYQRGVKLIGATAHYATADLDEGPIIAQNVTPISHRNSVEDLMRKGKELERTTLAHALRLHLEKRVLSYKNKTVVFD
ncbi:MAG: formyltetrahydrofolate deformylase [Opitutales bacterium]